MKAEREDIKRRVTHALRTSTIHGVSHFSAATSRTSKIFWLFLLLAGISGFLFHLISVISHYLSVPVINLHFANNEPYQWPDITLCNPSSPIPFRTRSHLKEKWTSLINETKRRFGVVKILNYEDMNHVMALSSLTPVDFYHLDFVHGVYADYGHKKIYFSVGAVNSSTQLAEYRNGFFSRVVHNYFPMPCFTFRADLYEKTLGAEFANFTRELKTLEFLLISDFEDFRFFNAHNSQPRVVFYLDYIDNLQRHEGYPAVPGFNTYVDAEMLRTHYFKKKHRCNEKPYVIELYDAYLTSTRNYTGNHVDCELIMSQKIYVELCGCYNPLLPIYKSHSDPPRLCLNMTLFSDEEMLKNLKCLRQTFESYTRNETYNSFVVKSCEKFRKPACTSVIYLNNFKSEMMVESWTRDSSSIRDNHHYNLASTFLGANRTNYYDKIRKSVVTIRIRGGFSFLVKQEPQYPLPELLSDIGGIMGLWIGLSVIGFFELMTFLKLFVKYLGLYMRFHAMESGQYDGEEQQERNPEDCSC